jgi:hypothetical protein
VAGDGQPPAVIERYSVAVLHKETAMRRFVTALMVCALLPTAAAAADDDALDALAGKMFSEQNMSLFFGLMRQSLVAARDGKAAPEIPPETVARLQKLAADARTDMLNASLLMLDQVEKDFRQDLPSTQVK